MCLVSAQKMVPFFEEEGTWICFYCWVCTLFGGLATKETRGGKDVDLTNDLNDFKNVRFQEFFLWKFSIILTQPMAKRLKLFGITYLVGKIKFRSNGFFFRVHLLAEWVGFNLLEFLSTRIVSNLDYPGLRPQGTLQVSPCLTMSKFWCVCVCEAPEVHFPWKSILTIYWMVFPKRPLF